MKKRIVLVCFICLLCAMLVSCNNQKTETTQTESTQTEATQTEVVVEKAKPKDVTEMGNVVFSIPADWEISNVDRMSLIFPDVKNDRVIGADFSTSYSAEGKFLGMSIEGNLSDQMDAMLDHNILGDPYDKRKVEKSNLSMEKTKISGLNANRIYTDYTIGDQNGYFELLYIDNGADSMIFSFKSSNKDKERLREDINMVVNSLQITK